MKVTILFDHFGPYHIARLTAASEVCDVVGVSGGMSSKEYRWRSAQYGSFPIIAINEAGPGGDLKGPDFRQRLNAALDEADPDVVAIPGWSGRQAFDALRWAASRCRPVVIMSESTLWDEPRVTWKEWVKRRFIGLASASLVGGSPHTAYMLQLGMPNDRIFPGYDAVDNGYFAAEAERWRCQSAVGSSRKYFLSSNRFIEKKNLFRLLEAYARYLKSGQLSVGSCRCDDAEPTTRNRQRTTDNGQSTSLPWNLCMLGDGELKSKLLAHCADLGLHVVESAPWEASGNAEASFQRSDVSISAFPSPTVFFPGFRQVEELPRFYANAGAFVHASTTEQWGLVVNEAMASGLPVIVANRVGCAQDLVQVGINGFTFDPMNVAQLADTMLKISEMPPAILSGFGDASQRLIADWGPERFASGVRSACEKALEIGPQRAGVMDRLLLFMLALK